MEAKMKKISDFGLLDRLILKGIHKLQKYAINNYHIDMYNKLFKIHFRRYFGLDLHTEVIALSEEGKAAMRRHGRIIVRVVYPNQRPGVKKMIYKASAIAFRDNIILEMKL